MSSVAIFGAGISGLAAARELSRSGFDVTVFEKEQFPGGLSATHIDKDGLFYDRGPHYFFTTLADKVGITEKCIRVPYYENIFYGNRYYSFPFGLAKNSEFFLSVLFSYLKSVLSKRDREYEDLNALLRANYGKAFTSKVLGPLIEKWSGTPIEKISSDFGKRLLPGNLRYILYSVVKQIRGYTEDYYEKGRYIVYPKGGMKTVFDELLNSGEFSVEYNSELKALHLKDDRIAVAALNNNEVKADYYISTIPLNEIAYMAPDNGMLKTYNKFRYRGIILVYIRLSSSGVLKKLWNWYPESNISFYRLSQQLKHEGLGNHDDDRTVLAYEVGSFKGDDLWQRTDNELFELCIDQSTGHVDLNKKNIVEYKVERIPAAYPLVMKSYQDEQRNIVCKTGIENLFLAGRTGQCKYYMLEESFDSGIEAARNIIDLS